MIYRGKKSPKAFFAKLAKFSGFTRFYQWFTLRIRLGNQPDMPTITTDKLWFLRENRFLFLTRDGPIEITLKPSFVLTGILVCMVGVAAIFYYTLIASYSAIEVMRDETIQTAEASIGKKRIDLATTSVMTWQEYQPSSSLGPLFPEINREHAQPSKTITRSTDSIPRSLIPKTSPYEKTMGEDASDYLPMIIQGGKRVTFADDEKTENSGTTLDTLSSRELTKGPVRTSFSSDRAKTSKTVVPNTKASPDSTNQKNIRKPLNYADIKPEAKNNFGTEILAETTSRNSSALVQTTKKDEMETSGLTSRAREYAVALLPSFMAKPNSIKPNTDAEKTKVFEKNAEIAQDPKLASTVNVIEDDGLLTRKNDTQSSPVLPVVSEAARIKKMLLAYKQEINYIRSTVVSLGIPQDELPAAPLSKNQTNSQLNDQDFRSLMIKLAEHRAALRKIPFKPPMLYFYVSSGYGMRKHPKTGKRSFHHGIDLAGTWQENVRTTAPGRIVYAGSEGAFGKVVRVQHEFGVVTTYAHLARITVKLGDYVSEGHVVGKMGNTGRSVGAHLHYEIRVNGKSIDPNKFMKVGRQLSVAGELRQTSLNQ
jgi:murein DD-endopeptidase MepM/ murein hydrolase activator NlpD